jgi:hypothetical protein
MHDFQNVTLAQHHIGQSRARGDLAIAFDRDLGGIEPDVGDQIGDGSAACDTARFAVDGEEIDVSDMAKAHARSMRVAQVPDMGRGQQAYAHDGQRRLGQPVGRNQPAGHQRQAGAAQQQRPAPPMRMIPPPSPSAPITTAAARPYS